MLLGLGGLAPANPNNASAAACCMHTKICPWLRYLLLLRFMY